MNILLGAVDASGFQKIQPEVPVSVKRITKAQNIIKALSWVPVLGTIIGIVRIVTAPIFFKIMQNEYSKHSVELTKDFKQIHKCSLAWSIIRGSCEILTLGFFAPINIVADSASSIFHAMNRALEDRTKAQDSLFAVNELKKGDFGD